MDHRENARSEEGARVSSTTVILNEFGGGSLQRRTRTTASGKTSDRYTITIDAEPFGLNFDTKQLGSGVAQAIANHLRTRISEIGAQASPATLRARKNAETAFSAGKQWAMRRYAGGRTGATPPNQSTRIGNDSGRLANGIVANPTKDNNWVINVPANRLNAQFLGSEEALLRVIERIRQYVPEFGSAHEMTTVLSVRRAMKDAVKAIHTKTRTSRLREFGKGLIQTVLREVINL